MEILLYILTPFSAHRATLVGERGTADWGCWRSLPMAESGETQIGAGPGEMRSFRSALIGASGLRRRSRRSPGLAW